MRVDRIVFWVYNCGQKIRVKNLDMLLVSGPHPWIFRGCVSVTNDQSIRRIRLFDRGDIATTNLDTESTMRNPTLAQTGGLAGSIGDDLRQIQDQLDGERIQLALNNPDHPFRQGVVTLALAQFFAVTWTEKGSIIHVTFISNGWSGPEWKEHFKKKGVQLSPNALEILDSTEFKASKAGTVRQVALLKGELFNESDRITSKIRAKAAELKLKTLDMEVICLIRDTFSNAEINKMGFLWIVGMHDSVEIDGALYLLTAVAYGVVPGLEALYDRPDFRWSREGGFAFAVQQVELKA